jgi:hypothetical protein
MGHTVITASLSRFRPYAYLLERLGYLVTTGLPVFLFGCRDDGVVVESAHWQS